MRLRTAICTFGRMLHNADVLWCVQKPLNNQQQTARTTFDSIRVYFLFASILIVLCDTQTKVEPNMLLLVFTQTRISYTDLAHIVIICKFGRNYSVFTALRYIFTFCAK